MGCGCCNVPTSMGRGVWVGWRCWTCCEGGGVWLIVCCGERTIPCPPKPRNPGGHAAFAPVWWRRVRGVEARRVARARGRRPVLVDDLGVRHAAGQPVCKLLRQLRTARRLAGSPTCQACRTESPQMDVFGFGRCSPQTYHIRIVIRYLEVRYLVYSQFTMSIWGDSILHA